ncbi:MAG: polysaccharide biosynthesis/export family protein [Candidatus Eisenbacteria bacterium]
MTAFRGWGRFASLLLVLATVFAPLRAFAEEYVLGPEDVIAISVWMHPELERQLTINSEGNVVLPPIGEVKAAGQTTRQVSERLADQLTRYLRSTTTVTVTVAQFMSRSVYVTGAVAKPGRYGFEHLPPLPDVIAQAGGANAGADLSQAQILRKEGDQRRTIAVDLASVLRGGDTSTLPELKPGDTVVIPGPGTGQGGATDGVGVLGEVVKPGLYATAGKLDLWAAIALSGGLTARGNLSDVRILTRTDGGLTVTTVNLRDVLDHGARASVTLGAGDVVVVMPKGPTLWSTFTTLLGLSRDLLNIVVVADYLQNKKSN